MVGHIAKIGGNDPVKLLDRNCSSFSCVNAARKVGKEPVKTLELKYKYSKLVSIPISVGIKDKALLFKLIFFKEALE